MSLAAQDLGFSVDFVLNPAVSFSCHRISTALLPLMETPQSLFLSPQHDSPELKQKLRKLKARIPLAEARNPALLFQCLETFGTCGMSECLILIVENKLLFMHQQRCCWNSEFLNRETCISRASPLFWLSITLSLLALVYLHKEIQVLSSVISFINGIFLYLTS